MNQQEFEIKAKEAFSDEAYVRELLELDTAEEVQASLKGKGMELSIEEIIQLKQLLAKSAEGELSDEDLETVSGGCIAATVIFVAAMVAPWLVGVGVGINDAVRRRW